MTSPCYQGASTSWPKMAVRALVITSDLHSSQLERGSDKKGQSSLSHEVASWKLQISLVETWPPDHTQCRRSQIMQVGSCVAGYLTRCPVLITTEETRGYREKSSRFQHNCYVLYYLYKNQSYKNFNKWWYHRCGLSFSPWGKAENLLKKHLLENKSLVVA